MRFVVCILAVGLLASFGLVGCGGGGGGGNDTPPNPFAGNYSGTYTGAEDGTWTLVFGTDGTVSATVHSPSVGTFTGTGTISSTGDLNLITSGSGVGGGFTITWQGAFETQGSETTGSGTWESTSGFSGTWTGEKN